MQETDDLSLLREYVERDSEEAFAALVARHVNKVYSVALRHTGNPHQAEEITQAVFVILAKKSRHLGKRVILSGWLYQAARLTAVTFIRSDIRRARREQEAYMQTMVNETGTDDWPRIAPLLDAAMAGLNETDRHAVVLRYFDAKSMKEVGTALGASEDTAKRRVNRAVEKLRRFFTKRGVMLPAAVLTAAISANSVQAAPAALVKSVTAVAIAKGAAASGSTLTLIKGALKLMAWTKAKTAIIVSVGVLLAAGTTTVAFKEFSSPSIEDVFKHYREARYLEKAPPVVILRPSRHPGHGVDHMHGPPFSVASERFVGLSQTLDWVLSVAYDVGPERMVLPPNLPQSSFEFLVTVPNDPKGALREEIKKQFGIVAHAEIQEKNVLLLKVVNPGAPALKINRSGSTDGGCSADDGVLKVNNLKMAGQTAVLGRDASGAPIMRTNLDNSIVRSIGPAYYGLPVIDETGLTESYDFELRWDPKIKDQTAAIKNALREQLGLELIPARRPVEMLVVEYENPHQVDAPIPQAAWSLTGYATPEDAFQSTLWAMNQGDMKTFLASLTPECQQRFMGKDGRGKSDREMATGNQHKAAQIAAFQVISQEVLPDDEVVLYIRSPRLGNASVTLKRINGEWKMAEEPH